LDFGINKTQTIRFGSARYSLPTEWVSKVVEVSVVDHEVVLAYDGRQTQPGATGQNLETESA